MTAMASPRSPLSTSSSSSGFPSAPSPPPPPAAPKNPWTKSLNSGDAPAVMGEPSSWPPLALSPQQRSPRQPPPPPLLPTPVIADRRVSPSEERVSQEPQPAVIDPSTATPVPPPPPPPPPAAADADVPRPPAASRKPQHQHGKTQQKYKRAQHPRSIGGGRGGGHLNFIPHHNGYMNGFGVPDWSSGPGFRPEWRPHHNFQPEWRPHPNFQPEWPPHPNFQREWPPHPNWAPHQPPIAARPPLWPDHANVAPPQAFWAPYPNNNENYFHHGVDGFVEPYETEFYRMNAYHMPDATPFHLAMNGFLPVDSVHLFREQNWNHQDKGTQMQHQIAEEIPNHQDKKMDLQRPREEENLDHRDKKAELRSQIEYYFSEDNLARSYHMRLQMDSEGWVDIHTIAGFNKVKNLTRDVNLVREALQSSDTVELQGDKMRRRDGWMKYIVVPNQSSLITSMEKMSLDEELVQTSAIVNSA